MFHLLFYTLMLKLFDSLTSAWEHIWKVEDALVPMMTDTLVFLVLLGLHSHPGRSRHRPERETERPYLSRYLNDVSKIIGFLTPPFSVPS